MGSIRTAWGMMSTHWRKVKARLDSPTPQATRDHIEALDVDLNVVAGDREAGTHCLFVPCAIKTQWVVDRGIRASHGGDPSRQTGGVSAVRST
jgi:hypothetical protein